jgi:hypothetical protein
MESRVCKCGLGPFLTYTVYGTTVLAVSREDAQRGLDFESDPRTGRPDHDVYSTEGITIAVGTCRKGKKDR